MAFRHRQRRYSIKPKAVEKTNIPWRSAVEIIKPHIVKIMTPRGSGTGFLCAYTSDKILCGIATAAHVVNQSHFWEEPIRIQHFNSHSTILLRIQNRIIYSDMNLDTAVIIFKKGELPLPTKTLEFIRKRKYLKVGEEIGWVGFPAMSPNDLCFFSGRNSCWLNDEKTYLVDGVAINGVSGGPAFYPTEKGIKIIGSVTAYLPNRVGLSPGLAMIRDVDHYLKVIKTIKDFDEAKKKETPATGINEQNKIMVSN